MVISSTLSEYCISQLLHNSLSICRSRSFWNVIRPITSHIPIYPRDIVLPDVVHYAEYNCKNINVRSSFYYTSITRNDHKLVVAPHQGTTCLEIK